MKHFVLKKKDKEKSEASEASSFKEKSETNRSNDSQNYLNISNPIIKEIAISSDLKNEKNEKNEKKDLNIRKLVNTIYIFKEESEMRKWLSKTGKSHLIDFSDKKRTKLKFCFESLDVKKTGSIGILDLEEPFISLGIAENRMDVKKIIDTVDDDGSGIIKNKNTDKGNSSAVHEFFNDMINGTLAGGTIPNNLSFDMILSTVRRKKMINAFLGIEEGDKLEGEKVMRAYAKFLSLRKIKKNEDKNEEKNEDNIALKNENEINNKKEGGNMNTIKQLNLALERD